MKKLGMKTLTDYVGRESARILEESGYRSREDIMSARVIDLLLIGSFSVFSLERLIVALYREEHPLTVESIEKNLNDVAGVRIICSYTSDIYMLADAFIRQDDITLLERKDYIEDPKPNGYRSLHLIVEIPIFLHDEKRMMKVEVQFRTISMDFWASLEHKIRYKKELPVIEEVEKELYECAIVSAELENRMERIQKLADQYRAYEK
jgi:putative GTP pyrophosphokinase